MVEGIVFKGGGEPTLHPDFGTMVKRAVHLGFSVGVVTNGSKLGMWASILAEHAAYVRISIDGPTPESHERIHGSKDFESILDGVKSLVEARRGRRHPVIGLSFAMDIHSMALADEAILLSKKLGVDYVLLRPPFFEEVGREPTMNVTEAQQVRCWLREVATNHSGSLDIMVGDWVGDAEQNAMQMKTLESAGRRDLHVGVKLPIEHRTGNCFASPLLAVITAAGEVYGCCNLRALTDWSYGRLDYSEGVGFADIWSGDGRLIIQAKMQKTQCIQHCTHPLSKYNEIIEVLRDIERPHSQFI